MANDVTNNNSDAANHLKKKITQTLFPFVLLPSSQ